MNIYTHPQMHRAYVQLGHCGISSSASHEVGQEQKKIGMELGYSEIFQL
jgi:hypothetical protein